MSENKELDRGIPSVTDDEKENGVVQTIVIIIVAVIVILLLIAVNGGFSSEKKDAETQEPKSNNVRNILGDAPAEIEEAVEPLKQVVKAPLRTKQPPIPVAVKSRSGGKKELTPQQRKMQSVALTKQSGKNKGNAENAALSAQLKALQDADKADGLAASLKATKVKGTRAGLLVDRNMFITQGTFIDCALETAISSDLAGMISCRMTRDVYSTSGKVLLLERGSKIVGEYKGGLTKGTARVFALWNRVETPTGVLIDLASPGTGPLGRAGHGGYVDTHFWERFSGAILLSVIDDVGNYISTQANKGNGDSISFGGTSEAAGNASSIALKNSINIPPTLHKNQGEHINVFVARDLDFRGVYELEPAD